MVVAGFSSTLVAPTLKLTRFGSLVRLGSSRFKFGFFGCSCLGSKTGDGWTIERPEGCELKLSAKLGGKRTEEEGEDSLGGT